jgi:RND family efflux transporter MFP subunit
MKFMHINKKLLPWIGGGIVICVLVVAGVMWYVRTNQMPSFGTVAVGRGNVVASLNEPGNVLAENSVDLSFEEGGQIASVDVKEGDTVAQGAVLAKLDSSLLQTAVQQANAALAAAQATLDNLANGTRPEQLQIDQDAVAAAQAAVNSALSSLSASNGSAYVTADDAVHNQTDNLFMNPQYNNPNFLIPMTDSQMKIDIVAKRVALEPLLDGWYASANATGTDPSAESNIVSANLLTIKSYLDELAVAVNNATQSSSMSAATLAGYRGNVETARNEITQMIAGLTGAQSALSSAESNLTVTQSELSLAQAGATTEEIEAQKAVVAQAQAAVSSAEVAFDHATLTAPFSGTVRNLTAKIGQVVAAGTPVVSLTNDIGLKIEAYVSQSDVALIKEGEAANVTLDAYGDGVVFPATVTTIDSEGTEVNGSLAYKVTLYFAQPDQRIKASMTANVHIVTAEHDNVIEVPNKLIITDGDQNFVMVQNGSALEKRQVTVGVTGDDGMTEITSGLSAGDHINNF